MRTDANRIEFRRAGYAKTSEGRHFEPKTRLDRHQAESLVLELPPPGAMRWGVRSKAAVVIAIRDGKLTLDEACQRYALSTAEYFSWESCFNAYGLQGLGMDGRRLRRRGLPHSEK